MLFLVCAAKPPFGGQLLHRIFATFFPSLRDVLAHGGLATAYLARQEAAPAASSPARQAPGTTPSQTDATFLPISALPAAHRGAMPPNEPLRVAISAGLLVALLAVGWWALLAQTNYQGNWRALFLHGHKVGLPAALLPITPSPATEYGFDGQYYRMLAHDPLLQQDTIAHLDLPRLRYGRPLLPLLAWLLGGGSREAIDYAYLAVLALLLGSGAAGSVWLAYHWALPRPWLAALLFLLLPGSLISLQRFTVDVGLATFTVAYLVAFVAGGRWTLALAVAAACLCRETGLLLAGGHVYWLATQTRWRQMVWPILATVPYAAWHWHAAQVTPPSPELSTGFVPFRTYWELWQSPLDPARLPGLALLARGFDWMALVGVTLAIGAALQTAWLARKQGFVWRLPPWHWCAFLFAGLGFLLLGESEWHRGYDLGRVLTPLLILHAVVHRQSLWRAFTPLLFVLPRYLVLVGSELLTLIL